MKRHTFLAYGGWTLYEPSSEPGGEIADAYEPRSGVACCAAKLAITGRRVRVVEVWISWRNDGKVERLLGYTTDDRIPPHGRWHRDGDCSVRVNHMLDLRP